jgi:catechol 2,3-dioxygenase
LLEHGWPIDGAAHHGVSEAIYLRDPDYNGIELYSDVPRDVWHWENGSLTMVTDPLDVDNLLSEAGEWNGIDPSTDIGHLHLQVSDLPRSEQFYHGLLGLDVTQRSYPGALFLSAGGYHHHIGLNTWAGQGAPAPPQNSVGLSSFAIQMPDRQSWKALKRRLESASLLDARIHSSRQFLLHDPDGIRIEVVPSN